MRECGTVGTRTPTLKRMYNNMTVQIYIHIMIHRDHIAAYLYTIHVYPICKVSGSTVVRNHSRVKY